MNTNLLLIPSFDQKMVLDQSNWYYKGDTTLKPIRNAVFTETPW